MPAFCRKQLKRRCAINLQDSITRAAKMAREQAKDMVVGKNEADEWVILPMDDSASDLLESSVIVNENGLKYPEDHELVARLIASQ